VSGYDLREAALDLAASGVAVFPCGPDKAPRTPRGFHDATTDAEVIGRLDWNGGGMIGAAIAPGVVVVDVDPRNGGNETMNLLFEQGREIPDTAIVRTGGGGFHYYLAVPEGLKLRGSLGPGVDIKRSGKGYVVTPPSPGYEAVNALAPAPAPAWLLEELAVPDAPVGTDEPSEPKFFDWESGTPYGVAALEREAGRLAMAEEGGRNDALNRAAFGLAQLVAGGELSEARALDALEAGAERLGLEDAEARATIKSGWMAGEAEPRQAPPLEPKASFGEFVPTPLGDHRPEPTPDAESEGRFWVDWNVDEPALPFYCYPLLPRNAYVLVYGATEASKSMAWVGLLCQGSHRDVRSSVYSLENPPATDRDRLRRWKPEPSNFRLTNEPIDFNDARQVANLVRRESDWGDGRGSDVVVIDTYSHAFNSRSDDGNAKAIEFARVVRHVMAAVGCSVVVIDHTGYAQEDEPRDASAKRQQVDVALLMKKAGEWRPGAPSRFTITNKKAARFANPCFLTGAIADTDNRGLDLQWVGEGPRWSHAG
jgi:hypothetical protein